MRAELLYEWPALARISHGTLTPLTVGQFSRAEIDIYLAVIREQREQIEWERMHG